MMVTIACRKSVKMSRMLGMVSNGRSSRIQDACGIRLHRFASAESAADAPRLLILEGNVGDSYRLPPTDYEFTILRKCERDQLTGRVLPPCRHDDVLLAVQHVGHRSPCRSSGQLHLPQHFT